ncbi:MAG: serine/threonine-protein kinase [Anaerolineae bacterium]
MNLVGKRLGNYRIVEEIAHGGMGVIYRGIQEPLGREVAVKVMTESLARDQSFVDRFIREAQIASRLNHPQIVHIYDQGQLNGYLYIAMEMVPGHTLGELIAARGRFPIPEVVNLTQQICDVLAYAHAEGIIHRDIKPSNLILDQHGKIKVTDFGLAKALALPSFTATGELLGSPDYLSPEQFRGQPADERTDLYAVGLILFELATGQRPYSAEDAASLMYKVLHDPVPSPRDLLPEIPKTLEGIILRCLEKAPQDRFPSSRYLSEALEGVRDRAAPALAVPRVSTTAIPGDMPRIVWQSVLVILALAAMYGIELLGVGTSAIRAWLHPALALAATVATGISLGVGPGALSGLLLALGQVWLPHPFLRTLLAQGLYLALSGSILVSTGAVAGWAEARPRRAALALGLMGISFFAFLLLANLLLASAFPFLRDQPLRQARGALGGLGGGALVVLLAAYLLVGLLAALYRWFVLPQSDTATGSNPIK